MIRYKQISDSSIAPLIYNKVEKILGTKGHKMEFSEFAQKLHRSIGTKMGQSSFVQYLFFSIVTDEKYLPEGKDRVYKYYFTGRTSIKLVARAIVSHVDRDKFLSEFVELDDVDDDAVDTLIKEFRDEIPGINNFNYNLEIANKFKEIIVAAAKKGSEYIKKDISKLRIDLYDECNHICPISKEPLYLTGEKKFITLKIDKKDTSSHDNCLAVSPLIDKKYFDDSLETSLFLETLKINVKELYDIEIALNDVTIDEKLIAIVRTIPNFDLDKPSKLRYKPIRIKKKITDDEFLYRKVSMYVEAYYDILYKEFSLIDGENNFSFKKLCMQVRNAFLKYENSNISQQIIFDNLSMYFQRKLICSSTEADIILSFFIQDCEVFNEVTK